MTRSFSSVPPTLTYRTGCSAGVLGKCLSGVIARWRPTHKPLRQRAITSGMNDIPNFDFVRFDSLRSFQAVRHIDLVIDDTIMWDSDLTRARGGYLGDTLSPLPRIQLGLRDQPRSRPNTSRLEFGAPRLTQTHGRQSCWKWPRIRSTIKPPRRPRPRTPQSALRLSRAAALWSSALSGE